MTEPITYTVKQASLSDLETHLWECNASFIPPLSEKVDLKTYARKIYDKAMTFEAWDATKLIGSIASYFNDENRRTGFITNVSVNPLWTGKHIAATLLENCVNYAKQHHFAAIRLEVNKNNTKAIGLYSKYGFKEMGAEENNLTMEWKNEQVK